MRIIENDAIILYIRKLDKYYLTFQHLYLQIMIQRTIQDKQSYNIKDLRSQVRSIAQIYYYNKNDRKIYFSLIPPKQSSSKNLYPQKYLFSMRYVDIIVNVLEGNKIKRTAKQYPNVIEFFLQTKHVPHYIVDPLTRRILIPSILPQKPRDSLQKIFFNLSQAFYYPFWQDKAGTLLEKKFFIVNIPFYSQMREKKDSQQQMQTVFKKFGALQ